MRLLIYLLAMMTGFSAAEAARPVAAAPAAVAQSAVVAASVALGEQKTIPVALQTVPVLPTLSILPEQGVLGIFSASATPVSRHDLIRE